MKMADGGFRPAYNFQIASAPERQIVVSVEVETTGSDRGLMRPMLEELERRYGRLPSAIWPTAASARTPTSNGRPANGVEVYCPPAGASTAPIPIAPRPTTVPASPPGAGA